jgi:hypothetical protein
MRHDFSNRVDWLAPTLALIAWAAHFTLLWSASSIFPEQPLARWIAVALTMVALAALAWIWRRRAVRTVQSIPGLGIAIAAVAITFSALPALIG